MPGQTVKETPCILSQYSVSISSRTWLHFNVCLFHKKRTHALNLLLTKTQWQVATVLLTGVLQHRQEDTGEYKFVTGWTERYLRIFFLNVSVWIGFDVKVVTSALLTLSKKCRSVFPLRVPVVWIWHDIHRLHVLRDTVTNTIIFSEFHEVKSEFEISVRTDCMAQSNLRSNKVGFSVGLIRLKLECKVQDR